MSPTPIDAGVAISHWRRTLKGGLKEACKDLLAIRRMPRAFAREVLLTFDDGPSRTTTPKVLDMLDKAGAKAIFFVIGRRVEGAPELLGEIVRRGHLLGNHSFEHPNHIDKGPVWCYLDAKRCQKTIFELSGVAPRLYRPPGGNLAPGFVLGSRLAGLRVMHWTLQVDDWRCRTLDEAALAARRLTLELAGGDIVLLHDDNEMVLPILSSLLQHLASAGLTTATPGRCIDKLLARSRRH